MQPLVTHTGRALPLRRSNVDTDQIIPSAYCRRLTKTGYADGLFARWRQDPGFVFNQPRYAGSSVLLAGPDFGIGSSREHAVWALRDWGFAVVVAAGFGDIFRRNALTNGLLAVALPEAAVDGLLDLAEADGGLEVTVDLLRCEVTADGRGWPFEVDPRARRLLLEGRDTVDVTLEKEPAIAAYEATRARWLPSVPAGDSTAAGLVSVGR